VRREKRLRRSSRWQRQPDGSILLRIPIRTPKRDIPGLLESVQKQLEKPAKLRRARTDADLQSRAERLNRTCFDGQLEWRAIRWVSNMTITLGSCSTGGATDGHIRISAKIKDWPDWVLDYVIAHELAHTRHPDHSPAFWDFLRAGYPKTEQARGFIKGIGFAQGRSFTEDG